MAAAAITALAGPLLNLMFGGSGSQSAYVDPELLNTMRNIMNFQYQQMQANAPLQDSIRSLAGYLLPTKFQPGAAPSGPTATGYTVTTPPQDYGTSGNATGPGHAGGGVNPFQI